MSNDGNNYRESSWSWRLGHGWLGKMTKRTNFWKGQQNPPQQTIRSLTAC
jgi:hypothetical protein